MKLTLHSLVILGSFVVYLLWEKLFQTNYTTFGIGLFGFVFLCTSLVQRKRSKKHSPLNIQHMLDLDALSIFALSSLVLVLIGSTGGFSSGFFFLLYFLSFLIGFFLLPETVFFFPFLCFFLFLPSAGSRLEDWLRLGSLFLLSPLAYYFSETIRERFQFDREREQAAALASAVTEEIVSEMNELALTKREVLKSEDLDKMAAIIKNAEDLEQEIKSQA